jgi:hypothetical protein
VIFESYLGRYNDHQVGWLVFVENDDGSFTPWMHEGGRGAVSRGPELPEPHPRWFATAPDAADAARGRFSAARVYVVPASRMVTENFRTTADREHWTLIE